MPPSRGSALRRAILTRAVVYVPDVREDPEFRLQSWLRRVGFRSVLGVPMLRDGNPIGTINVTGAEAGDVLRTSDRHAPDLRRPGGDRDREHAAVQRAARRATAT